MCIPNTSRRRQPGTKMTLSTNANRSVVIVARTIQSVYHACYCHQLFSMCPARHQIVIQKLIMCPRPLGKHLLAAKALSIIKGIYRVHHSRSSVTKCIWSFVCSSDDGSSLDTYITQKHIQKRFLCTFSEA